MLGIDKKQLKKRTTAIGRNVELGLTIAIDMYVIAIIAYGALYVRGLLPAPQYAKHVLWVSLGLFAFVRFVVAIARGHRVVK